MSFFYALIFQMQVSASMKCAMVSTTHTNLNRENIRDGNALHVQVKPSFFKRLHNLRRSLEFIDFSLLHSFLSTP